jgi:alpha-tubulin suppressor-like RCC1 family protein
MAIKISGTDVINQSRSIVNAQDGYFAGVVTASNFSGSANLSFTSQNVTSVSGITTINLSLGSVVYFTHNTDTTVAFANTSTSQEVIFIRTKDITTTSRNIIWPSSVRWEGITGEPSLLQNGTSEVQIFNLVTRNSGTNWYAYESYNFPGTGSYLFVAGSNGSYGNLGLGDIINRSSPTQIAGNNWSTISMNSSSAIGIKTDGTMWSWGYGAPYGNLGRINITDNVSAPEKANDGTNWRKAEIGMTYPWGVATKTDDTAWSFGIGNYGQLGLNSTISRSSPTQISGTTWSSITTGFYSCLAVKTNATLWSWGYNHPTYGGLGLGDVIWRSSPTQIGSGTDWSTSPSSITMSVNYGLAIKSTGTLWAWGRNAKGNLGRNNTTDLLAATQVGTSSNWSKISSRDEYSFGIKTDGTLWSWGSNPNGNLGLNDIISRSSPTQIGSGNDWLDVRGGGSTRAVKTDGTLWTWGLNSSGQLANGNTIGPVSSPIQIQGKSWDLSGISYYDSVFVVKRTVV